MHWSMMVMIVDDGTLWMLEIDAYCLLLHYYETWLMMVNDGW